MKKLCDKNIPAIFQKNAEKYNDKSIVLYKKNSKGKYIDLSWNEMNSIVHRLGWYLLENGVKKGEKIAVYSDNRYEWWAADLAVLSVGAINVPIYATNSSEESYYILDHSDITTCFVGNEEQLDNILKVKKKLPKLKRIIFFGSLKSKKKDVISFYKALSEGDKYKNKSSFEKKIAAIKGDSIATIMYTSGTTGDPKGVIITHDNLVSNISQLMTIFDKHIGDKDIFLSFLPLSHSFERTAGYYIPLTAGAKVAFAENFQKVSQNIQDVRPTVLVSVPRLYEKIHSVILSKVSSASIIKRTIFSLAMKTAAKNVKRFCNNQQLKGFFAKKYNFFNKLIYSKLKYALGMDRLNIAVTGGGPLSVSDIEFFLGMGVRILEGYGLTETSPVTNVNPYEKMKPGSIGPAIPSTKIKISDEGEILIKGPQVMQGYYKNKKATAEAFTKNGFLKTGDLGVFDEDGYLIITGRIKDIIVTAGGKNISPQNIENKLKESSFIEQIAVIGDHRKYLSALIVPEFEELKAWAKKHGLKSTSKNDLIKNKNVIKLFQAEIDKYAELFSRVEQIKKFTLLSSEWSQATGELTPSLKVKRKVITSKYAEKIEDMYKDA